MDGSRVIKRGVKPGTQFGLVELSYRQATPLKYRLATMFKAQPRVQIMKQKLNYICTGHFWLVQKESGRVKNG